MWRRKRRPLQLTAEQRAQAYRMACEQLAERERVRAGLRTGELTLAAALDRARTNRAIGRMATAELVAALPGGNLLQAAALLHRVGVPDRSHARLLDDRQRQAVVRAAAADDVDLDAMDWIRRAFADIRLGPPRGWPGVHAWEANWRVTLPEPYRSFVAVVGDGCPGGPPICGLLPLGEVPDRLHAVPTPDSVRRPFPLDRTWNWEEQQAWTEEDQARSGAAFTDGVLNLGDDGCGRFFMLVVTGSERGNVWQVGSLGAAPVGAGADADAGRRVDFATWVANWSWRLPGR
jgi:hypothetical protein